MRGRAWLGFPSLSSHQAPCPCLLSEFCPPYLFLERTQPRKTVMMKLVRTTWRIQVMCLMAVAVAFTQGSCSW